MTAHPCPGQCGQTVAHDKLACRRCWFRLPTNIRQWVSAAWLHRARDPRSHRAALAAASKWYRDQTTTVDGAR